MSVAVTKVARDVSDVITNVWRGSDVGRRLVTVMAYGYVVFEILRLDPHNSYLDLLLIVALHAMSSYFHTVTAKEH